VKVTLHPSLVDMLDDREDAEAFVNSILISYLHGEFIRKSDVAGMVNLNKAYRKTSLHGEQLFDAVTHEFKGVTVEGEKPSESIFIPSQKLHDLVAENQVLLVLKSRRSKCISHVETDTVFCQVQDDEMM
jgi:hypothetical protein